MFSRIRLLIFLFVIVVSQSSFHINNDEQIIAKVSENFKWIKTYLCIYDLFDKDQWENNAGRSFDSSGVHLTNNKYHPVNACHYALFCYDEYLKTKNERFKKGFLAQVGYLRDSTKYNLIDADKIGYPYNFNFHDLKSPWYSALAQSEAISVLVRYYALTKDRTILPVITKVKNFMVAPQSKDYGTMSITPEGNVWFEEYPNSTQERQVLNGFFLAVVAMYDYTNLFPADTEAREIYNKTIKSAKESIKFYDTGAWLKYNRGDQRLVANGYMKWLTLEMKLLYSITNDEFFYNQFMLWATYGYEKPYETPGCKLPFYNFSVPLVQLENTFSPLPKFTLEKINNKIDKYYGNLAPNNELIRILDGNKNSSLSVKNISTDFATEREASYIFPNEVNASAVRLNMIKADSVLLQNLEFFSYHSDNWKKIKVKEKHKEGEMLVFKFKKQNFKGIRIRLTQLPAVYNYQISEIELGNYSAAEPSDFFHYLSSVRQAEEKTVEIKLKLTDPGDYIIFYRSSADKLKIQTKLWNQEQSSKSNEFKIDLGADNFYQFLLVMKRKNNSTHLDEIKID